MKLLKAEQTEETFSRLLSAQALTDYLNVKLPTVRKWVRQGAIPHYKIGRLVRFNKAAIDIWLQQKIVNPRQTKLHYESKIPKPQFTQGHSH